MFGWAWLYISIPYWRSTQVFFFFLIIIISIYLERFSLAFTLSVSELCMTFKPSNMRRQIMSPLGETCSAGVFGCVGEHWQGYIYSNINCTRDKKTFSRCDIYKKNSRDVSFWSKMWNLIRMLLIMWLLALVDSLIANIAGQCLGWQREDVFFLSLSFT